LGNYAAGKMITKQTPKTPSDTTMIILNKTPRQISKTARPKVKESTVSTEEEETIVLSEKLGKQINITMGNSP